VFLVCVWVGKGCRCCLVLSCVLPLARHQSLATSPCTHQHAHEHQRNQTTRLSVAPPSSALHPSLHAALAWRHCQLLNALPNRGGEAAAWEACARDLWARWPAAAASSSGLEVVLGDKNALTGKGQHGGTWVVSLLARRLLVAGGASSTA